ncbi:MAG: AmmeMemoRadiSam system protein B [Anaerolineae bacterium]|jgi:AmmeMemoRadiSam system protein B|nr:AmmeMemoRadiSam system protein B [Anaerolineae bacterium]
MFKAHNARPSAIAGSWYPGNPTSLTTQIQNYLDQASPVVSEGNLLAIVVPHAGYIYSGQTAAFAFKLLEGRNIERVILCSPFHAMTYEALLTTSYPAYETPLGIIPIDESALAAIDDHLAENGMQKIHRMKHEQEHSLEIELPFLQTVLGDSFELVPLMVRTHQQVSLQVLATACAELAQEKPSLLVASTDLSHFNSARTAEILDSNVLVDIQNLDPAQLLADNQSGTGLACGAGAVALILYTAKLLGANHTDILNYTHSGVITGDNSSVVGYGAAAIYQQKS